jgi:hypothetical protein
MKIPNWQFLVIPAAAFAIGFLSNAIVMAANHGQMPVLLPGGMTIDSDDLIHSAMTAQTHLKFLADWIVIRGLGIASPGDFGEWLFDATFIPAFAIWVWARIQEHNRVPQALKSL